MASPAPTPRLVESDATAAMLTGTYKALLPTSTGSALSRFDTTAAASNWYRVDGMAVLPSANAWTTATLFDVAPEPERKGRRELRQLEQLEWWWVVDGGVHIRRHL